MERSGRDTPLPIEMQGQWVDIDDRTSELIIEGGEISCFGRRVEYDYKLVGVVDSVLTVSLKIADKTREDDFQRSNITELVFTPEGEFRAYNIKFASRFVRSNG